MIDSASSANAGELLQLRNCRLLRNHILHENVDLWVRHGRVIDPEKIFYDERRSADRVVDCYGAICAPGFIDMQINGGYGTDFSNIIGTDPSSSVIDGVRLVGRHIIEHGVTSFCPTLVTSPAETYRRILPHIRKQRGGRHGATVLGTHLEGPFINAGKKGAHPEHCIRDFVGAKGEGEKGEGFRTLLDMYGEDSLADVSIVTLAPEKPGAPAVISELTRRGITVALGHSTANMADGEAGVLAGSCLITHLFNAMLPVSLWAL